MTVQELIAQLQQLPAELPVFVDGYEYGVHVGRIRHGKVALNYWGEPDRADGKEGYGGAHEYIEEWTVEEIAAEKTVIDAVVISRKDP